MQLTEAQQQVAEALEAAGRHDRRAALLGAECDGLKRIVAAHSADAAAQQAAVGRADAAEAQAAELVTRAATLEQQLAALQVASPSTV